MPVRRKRRRYLSFRVDCSWDLDTKEVVDTVQRRVLDLYGFQGLSKIEPVLIDFDKDTQTGVLRSNRDGVLSLRAALTFCLNSRCPTASRELRRLCEFTELQEPSDL